MSSFICDNTVSAPIHGPGSGAAIAEPTLCVGFACGKKPKKPPLIPRRGARPRANPVALQHRHALPSGSICCVARACNTYSIAAPSLLASATVWQAVRRFRTTGFTQGPAGPFGNPGALMGSPETVYVSHKAKALCYNTVSFLPERLIRAPVLKPRPRSRAGRSTAETCLTHSPAVPGRFVGAACMRPVGVRLMAMFLVRVRGTLICRGGIHASRQG